MVFYVENLRIIYKEIFQLVCPDNSAKVHSICFNHVPTFLQFSCILCPITCQEKDYTFGKYNNVPKFSAILAHLDVKSAINAHVSWLKSQKKPVKKAVVFNWWFHGGVKWRNLTASLEWVTKNPRHFPHWMSWEVSFFFFIYITMHNYFPW